MAPHIVRNAITLLLILTLANLAASFAALRAVHTAQQSVRAHMMKVDTAISSLTIITSQLCAKHDDTCGETAAAAAAVH
jgi:hypothetical protein